MKTKLEKNGSFHKVSTTKNPERFSILSGCYTKKDYLKNKSSNEIELWQIQNEENRHLGKSQDKK